MKLPRMTRHSLLPMIAACLMLLLLGCPASFTVPDQRLEGQARFPAAYAAQATSTDVGLGATVSVIEIDTNRTVATTLTGADGKFQFAFRNWKPASGSFYALEAIKGLDNNGVGASVARMRSLLRYTSSGWVSLTSSTPGSPVYLTSSTTALTAGLSLKRAVGTIVAAESLLGALTLDTRSVPGLPPDTFAGAPDFTPTEFDSVWALVESALKQDVDPVAVMRWDTVTTSFTMSFANSPYVSGVVPNSAAVGTPLVLRGIRFAVPAASNSIYFNGVKAIPTNGSETTLEVTVPAGAVSGPLRVESPAGASNGVAFMVLNAIDGTFRGQSR